MGQTDTMQIQTEIDQIARDWKKSALATIAEPPQYGFTATASETGNTRFLRITDIEDWRINWSGMPYCTCPKEKLNKYLLRSGDIVFARIGATTGKSTLVTKPPNAVFASYLIRVRTKASIDACFLSYFFKSQGYWRQIDANKNANLKKGVSGSVLKTLVVPLPPLPEQYRIAAVLSLVQKVIEQQERLIALTTELKKALMHKLFTEGTRGEPQKQTEIGPVPESWEVVELGKIVEFKTGKLNSNAAVKNGKYPFFTCSQQNFRIDTYTFDQEAILLSGNNARAIYSVKYYKGKFNAYQRTYVITIRDKNQYDYQFLKSALSMNLEILRTISIGTSTKYLTLGLLKNLPMCYPSIEEQKTIAKALNAIESLIDVALSKKGNLSSLFQTLLHQLMTAEIRVNDLDLSELDILEQTVPDIQKEASA